MFAFTCMNEQKQPAFDVAASQISIVNCNAHRYVLLNTRRDSVHRLIPKRGGPCYVALCNNYAICNTLQTALNCNAICNTLQTAFSSFKKCGQNAVCNKCQNKTQFEIKLHTNDFPLFSCFISV